jgi:hypothetical protein
MASESHTHDPRELGRTATVVRPERIPLNNCADPSAEPSVAPGYTWLGQLTF